MAANRNNNRYTIRKSGRGFTLVEMIVVLVVISILAGVGIGSAVGYVKKARFEQNELNAKTVYQAAQTALQQKEKSGLLEDWTKDLTNDAVALASSSSNASSNADIEAMFNPSNFDSFPKSSSKPNESVHMRYVITYSSNSPESKQSKMLKDLIQPFFYDATIFSGTVTLEFDVEKTLDVYRNVRYSAKCLSAFVDSHSKNGWDGDATVPNRSLTYRRNTSYIGYFDGYSGTSVDTVYIPQVQIKVRKFAADYLPETVPNGSGEGSGAGSGEGESTTVETHTWLTWSATLDKDNLMGTGESVNYRLALLNGSNTSKVLILNESFMLFGENLNGVNLARVYEALANADDGENVIFKDKNNTNSVTYKVTVEEFPVEYEGFTKDVTIKSITVDAQVYIDSSDNSYESDSTTTIENNLHQDQNKIKLKISYISNEYNSDQTLKTPRFEYSLDITDYLETNTDGAKLTIYPNYFTHDSMKKYINTTGVLPFKTGKSIGIEQATTPPTPDP